MERRKNPVVEQMEKRKEYQEKQPDHSLLLIPTSVSLLNLACSDSVGGGWAVGKMVNLIGDSSSGKTLIALSMFAEMANDVRFDKFQLIYDDVERALEFDIEKLFGRKMKGRIQSPYEDNEYPDVYTVQEFQYNIEKLLKSDKPFVYVLDSFDSLSSKEEVERTEKQMKAMGSGKEISGSYRMEKPKVIGEVLRQIVGKMKNTQSMLLIISQTRDNIDPMLFQKKTRSGGNALRFYASHEIWLAVVEKLKYRDKVIGNRVRARITKNKITGKLRDVEFLTYYSLGLDDIGSCVDFLIEEGVWKKEKLTYVAENLGLSGTRERLIKQIEEDDREGDLKKEVQRVWFEIEESLKLDRKPRYRI